jgi:hypothetical protein
MNVRPYQSGVYNEIAERTGLEGVTATDSIDHLLVRGAEVASPAMAWPEEAREILDEGTGLAVRLSDHAPVGLTVRVP